MRGEAVGCPRISLRSETKRKGCEYEWSEIAKKKGLFRLFRFEAKRNIFYAKRNNTKRKIPKISLIFVKSRATVPVLCFYVTQHSNNTHTPLTHHLHTTYTPLTQHSQNTHTPVTLHSHNTDTTDTTLTQQSHNTHTTLTHHSHTTRTPLTHHSHTTHTPLTHHSHTTHSLTTGTNLQVQLC